MNHPLRLVILVSGRGSNMEALIRASQSGQIKSQIVAVIANNPDALALEKAKTHGILTKVVASKNIPPSEFHRDLLQTVSSFKPDLIVLAGFMKIISKEMVAAYPNKIINILLSIFIFVCLFAYKDSSWKCIYISF